MMYLLDTHTLLWFLRDDSRLSSTARSIIMDARSTTQASCISLWEIALKKSLVKLRFDHSITDIVQLCYESSITLLGISPDELDNLATLPFIHRDPFDRLLVSQARTRNLTIITKDSIIPKYDVRTIW